MPKIIYRKNAIQWRNCRISIPKRLGAINKKWLSIHETLAKKATTTYVGKKSIFLKKRPIDYFLFLFSPFPHPWLMQNWRDRDSYLKKIFEGLKSYGVKLLYAWFGLAWDNKNLYE